MGMCKMDKVEEYGMEMCLDGKVESGERKKCVHKEKA